MSALTSVAEGYRRLRPVNVMTVDVEDYFQVSAFEPHVSRADWAGKTSRVDDNVSRILDLFDASEIKATFFVLGWWAERLPQMVANIANRGHEVASHGFSHVRVTQQTAVEFREDVVRTKSLLEEATGQRVLGYRAASYSIGSRNLWAFDVLAGAGHVYSSSIYPIRHDHYGMPEAPRFAFRVDQLPLTEFPVSTLSAFGRNWPCGGGGYFRLLPYGLSKWAIRRLNTQERQPAIFYFHPWEIDPGQPQVRGLPWRTRFRHYHNLRRTEARLARLLSDFSWDRLDTVFGLRGAEPAHAQSGGA